MNVEYKSRYDCLKTANAVLELVVKHNIHGKFSISSFNRPLLKAVEIARLDYEKCYPRFDIVYLWNNFNHPLPTPDEYTANGDAINISFNHFTEEVFEICRSKGLKLGVWIRKQNYTEDDDFYHMMYESGVDFFSSDFPDRALEVRRRYEQKAKLICPLSP